MQKKMASPIEVILEHLPEKQEENFRKYFVNAPDSVLSAIRIEKRSPNQVLAEEHEPIEKIYILMEGIVRAIDYRIKGSAYEYALLKALRFWAPWSACLESRII